MITEIRISSTSGDHRKNRVPTIAYSRRTATTGTAGSVFRTGHAVRKSIPAAAVGVGWPVVQLVRTHALPAEIVYTGTRVLRRRPDRNRVYGIMWSRADAATIRHVYITQTAHCTWNVDSSSYDMSMRPVNNMSSARVRTNARARTSIMIR